MLKALDRTRVRSIETAIRSAWTTARGFWLASALAALSLLLVVSNEILSSRNQSLQDDINQRQQVINQAVQLSRLNENLIRALATAAASNNDDKIRALLATQGISYTVTPPSQAAAAAKSP
jgi:hypothetical protein